MIALLIQYLKGQVVQYFHQRLKNNAAYSQGLIISFEKPNILKKPSGLGQFNNIKILYYTQQTYLHTFSLNNCIQNLKILLLSLDEPYDIIARGPYAGYIALHALKQSSVVQAGLRSFTISSTRFISSRI